MTLVRLNLMTDVGPKGRPRSDRFIQYFGLRRSPQPCVGVELTDRPSGPVAVTGSGECDVSNLVKHLTIFFFFLRLLLFYSDFP